MESQYIASEKTKDCLQILIESATKHMKNGDIDKAENILKAVELICSSNLIEIQDHMDLKDKSCVGYDFKEVFSGENINKHDQLSIEIRILKCGNIGDSQNDEGRSVIAQINYALKHIKDAQKLLQVAEGILNIKKENVVKSSTLTFGAEVPNTSILKTDCIVTQDTAYSSIVSKEENKDNAVKCVQAAKRALSNGDLEKAEKFIIKANRMHQTIEGQNILAEINAAIVEKNASTNLESKPENTRYTTTSGKFKESSEEAQIEAERCVAIAEKAIAQNNLEKAERFLLKAERLYPTTNAQMLLATLHYEFEGRESSEQSEEEENKLSDDHKVSTEKPYKTIELKIPVIEHPIAPSDSDIHEVEKCINVAEDAILVDNLEKAERFLLKANRICPLPRTQELLAQVYHAVEEKKSSQKPDTSKSRHATKKASKIPKTKPDTDKSTEFNREDAEKCIEIAEAAISEHDYGKAERFLFKAERLCPGGTRAKELMWQVHAAIEERILEPLVIETDNPKAGKGVYGNGSTEARELEPIIGIDDLLEDDEPWVPLNPRASSTRNKVPTPRFGRATTRYQEEASGSGATKEDGSNTANTPGSDLPFIPLLQPLPFLTMRDFFK